MASKRPKTDKQPQSRGRTLLWVLLGAVAAAVLLAALLWGQRAPSGGLLDQLAGYKGYSRTVSEEEYDFFRALAAESLPAGGDLDEHTRAYIDRVNAKFYLGSRLGLCESLDLATLELRMEQENTIRAAKVADGQTVYGVTRFTLESYFRYVDTQLDAQVADYLVSHADKAMERGARDYFDAHPDVFLQLESITYQLEENGQTETIQAERTLLRNLENSDATLSDFLYAAQPGDTMDYQSAAGTARRVTLVETKTQMPTFDEARAAALDGWVRTQVLDDLYDTLAKNNPVKLDGNV